MAAVETTQERTVEDEAGGLAEARTSRAFLLAKASAHCGVTDSSEISEANRARVCLF